MGMINNKISKKVIYSLGSLFVFTSLSISNFVYADGKSDIAELEAFYHQVFNEKSDNNTNKVKNSLHSKAITAKSKNTNKVNKAVSLPVNKQKTDNKDPELVAFYEMVFGKPAASDPNLGKKLNNSVETYKISKNEHKSKKNKKELKIHSKNVTKKDSLKVLKETKPIVKSNKDIVEVSVTQEKLDAPSNVTESQTKNFISSNQSKVTLNEEPIPIESSNKDESENNGKRDNNHSTTQTKVTDTATLFERAFGKKKVKPDSSSTDEAPNKNDMASLFAKAFGKKSAIAVPSTVKVDVRVNANTIGEAELFSNSLGDFDQINTLHLLDILKDALKEHVFNRIKQQLINSKKTPINTLDKQGISAIYNPTNLSLDIEIKPELRKPLILSLRNKKKASVREENKVEAEKISGYLNAFTNVGLNSIGDDVDLKLRLEGSLNINGFVLESTGDYRNEEFDLGRTTLTYDKPEKLRRFALGNISTGNRNFQNNLELDGIRVSKEFFLDPDLQISPRANESLQLDTDSEVELYINNQLIRRFYLNAGVYALQDIGLYNGANNIRIRIKDEFGKVTIKKSEQYYDSHLLKPGLSLYAFSVGYLSNRQTNSNSSLEKTPIFSGYYQKGLSKDLTLSLDAQLSTENYLLGAETISSTPIGSLRSSIAISGGKELDTGYATSFEFKPNKKHEQISLDTLRQDLLGLDTRSRGFISSWSITGEYRSEDFSEFNEVNPNVNETSQTIDGVNFGNRVFNNNQFRGNLQTNFSLNISENWRGNLSLGAADYYDADMSYYANLSATKRFDNGMRLSLGTRYDTEDEFSMNLQFSIPLVRKKGKKRIDLDVLADSRDSAYETKLSVKPTSLVGKNSLAGSLEHFQDNDSKQQLLDIQYRNNLFESKLTARNRSTNGSNKNNQQLNLGINTAIACVGGACSTSYPINDSFALVSGPSNQTNPIALSNNGLRFKYSDGNDTGLPDSYSALITGKNKKAVVRLESYRSQIINVDEGTLPNGYDAEKTEFSVFPKYHQGFLIKAGGEPATTLDGMLYDEENKPLGFKGGQWVPLKDGKTVAFFSNKGGRFRVTSIPEGKYNLELFDYPDMEPIHIVVPDTKGKPYDIGNLVIKTPN